MVFDECATDRPAPKDEPRTLALSPAVVNSLVSGSTLGSAFTVGVRHHFRREAVSDTKDVMAENGA